MFFVQGAVDLCPRSLWNEHSNIMFIWRVYVFWWCHIPIPLHPSNGSESETGFRLCLRKGHGVEFGGIFKDRFHIPATFPIKPSKASTSRTKVPFPTPPIEGLHESSPTVSNFCVRSTVLAPVLAAPAAASHPAWPPPMTHTVIAIAVTISNCIGSGNWLHN